MGVEKLRCHTHIRLYLINRTRYRDKVSSNKVRPLIRTCILGHTHRYYFQWPWANHNPDFTWHRVARYLCNADSWASCFVFVYLRYPFQLIVRYVCMYVCMCGRLNRQHVSCWSVITRQTNAHWTLTGLPSRTSYHSALCLVLPLYLLLVDACVGLNWLLVSFFYHMLIKFIHPFIQSFIQSIIRLTHLTDWLTDWLKAPRNFICNLDTKIDIKSTTENLYNVHLRFTDSHFYSKDFTLFQQTI